MSQNKNNPYAKATTTYDTHAQTHTTNQRELEARILQKSNKMLRNCIDNWDNLPLGTLDEALKYNRQIWLLFYDTALENKDGNRPSDLRSNIINLANFIFKRELDIISKPTKEKLEILININHEISTGLMNNTNPAKKTHPTQPQQNQTSRTDITG